MKDFNYFLDYTGEMGYVEEVMSSIVYVSGLPDAKPQESVIFENGDLGQVISLKRKYIEVLIFGSNKIRVGTKVARTDEMLQFPVGDEYLGRMVNPLGVPLDNGKDLILSKFSAVDTQPHGIVGRKQVEKPLETGVTVVDLVIPLGKGQRELIIGDRKTGKTEFLLHVIYNQAIKGSVCIYSIIGQRQEDIKKRYEYIIEKKIEKNCVVVASCSSDPSGLIYLTPFSGMTIAEYFRDKGFDVLLILDDMTTHARIYREISLLARRFPGRDSYPGDIFYLHSRIMERAGNFKRGSITCLPVAETIMGDLSGYLQTNLMGMTDGHIFFDIDLYNQGKRPSISPFLSVTRVGHRPQTLLLRDVSRQLLSFLVSYERMKQFMHFGAEAEETIKGIIDLGKRIDIFFDQSDDSNISININVLILAGIWAGLWAEEELSNIKNSFEGIILNYSTNPEYKKRVDALIDSVRSFSDIVNKLRIDDSIFKTF